jgi:5-methylcytosine-specific restriction enzyme subunit McrC
MIPTQRLKQPRTLSIEMPEWSQQVFDVATPLDGWSLASDTAAQAIAISLKDKLEIRPGLKGSLEIATTSFVGRVAVGPLTITIRPKLHAMALAQLLRYAYQLRDIETFDDAPSPTATHGFHDLLVELLAAEVEELIYRGLASIYVPFSNRLESPRGRIDIQEVIRCGGVKEASLPCRYHERHTNWPLNQVLRAGLRYAANVTSDRDLRRRVNQLSARFASVDEEANLTTLDVDRAQGTLTRLTAAYRPALVVIKLLLTMQGVETAALSASIRTPGYLFDMNAFYQRLLSRFFHANLVGQTIRDEYSLRHTFSYAPAGNPRGRKAPSPRPDYALFDGKRLRGFLDAKYRDVWERGIPAHWLYQLSVYALASPSRMSTLLYATMSKDAVDEQIDIHNPGSTTRQVLASVILRPVHMERLAELVSSTNRRTLVGARQDYARDLSLLQLRSNRSQQKTIAVTA